MKSFRLTLLTLMLALGVALAQGGTLNLLIWSEYIDPDIVTQFEEEFDANVVIDTFESNEDALAKLEAGGLGLYDVVVPTDYIVPTFVELGVLQPLDREIVTNVANLSSQFIDPPYDPGNTYSVAYQWGTTGLAYRTDLADEPPTSWQVLFEPETHGQPVALIDSMREMIGLALMYSGYDLNSEDPDELTEARDVLMHAAEQSIGFYGGPAARNLLITGQATYVITYSGEVIGAFAEGADNLGYVIPEEGGQIWVDSMAVVANAPNPELANEFINFILRPEIGAQLTNYVAFASPNQAAIPLIDDEIREDPAVFPDEDTIERLYFVQDVENLELYDLIWTQIRAR